MFNSPGTPNLLNFPNPNLLSHATLSLNQSNNSNNNTHGSAASPSLFPPNFHQLHFPSQTPSTLPPFQLPDFSSSSSATALSAQNSVSGGSASPVSVGQFSPHNVLASLPPNILRSLPPNVLAQIAQIDSNHSFAPNNSNTTNNSAGHSSANLSATQSHSAHTISGLISPTLGSTDFTSRANPLSNSDDHPSKRQRLSSDFFGNLGTTNNNLGLSSLLLPANLPASLFTSTPNPTTGASQISSSASSSSMNPSPALSTSPPVNLRNHSLLASSADLNDDDSDDGDSGEKASGERGGRRKGGSGSADNDKDNIPDAKAKHRAVDARRRKREAEAFRILHDLTFPAAVQASGGASVLSSDRVSVLNRASDMIRSISEIRKNGEERLSSALRALENAKREKDVLEQELIILRQQLAIIDRERMQNASKAHKPAEEIQDDELSLVKRDSQGRIQPMSSSDSLMGLGEGNDLVRALRASDAAGTASSSSSAVSVPSSSALAPQSNSLIYRALHVLMNTWQQERRKYESRALHSSVFLDSTLSIIVTDMSGRVVDANRTVCHRLRFSREQLTGKYLSAIHAHVHLANPIFLTFLPNFMKTTRSNTTNAHDEKSTAHDADGRRNRSDDGNAAGANSATPPVTLFPSPASLASFVHLNANDVPHSTIGIGDPSNLEGQKDVLTLLSGAMPNTISSASSATHNSSSGGVGAMSVSAASAGKVAAYYEKSAPSLLSIRKLISLYSGASSVVVIEFKTVDAAYRLLSSLMRVWLVQDVTHGKPIYQVHCGIDANDDFKFESEFEPSKADDATGNTTASVHSPAMTDSDARRH